ncbi:MAG: YaaR family protein [Selenomonadaceae bacterium]|nr:YaaR family protein [Selenomonadaceae bacterium]MBR1580736.1 YaaR family protein [Selenomonadaceae bacterium]
MVTSTPTHSAFESFHDPTQRVSAKDMSFSEELLEQQSDGVTREQLEQMLKKIDEQAGRLSHSPTFDELKEYRTLIKNFISAAVGQMYELHTSAGWDRMGRQRAYTTVRKVDRKLEEMAEKIRLGQSEQLDIVASHDAIRGMLVDLYM